MSTQTLAAPPSVASVEPADPSPAPLLTRALMLRLVSVVGCSAGFYLPLSVMPLLAAEHGSAGSAGLTTVVLLLATVACELITPRVAAVIGYRWALAVGLVLLGAPALLLTATSAAWAVLLVSVLRGAGFGVAVVAGGAITVALLPADRRGQGLALVGLVGGVPGMLALPAGVWIVARWGFTPVFVATAVVSLLALASVPGVPSSPAGRAQSGQHGVVSVLRDPRQARLATLFVSSTAVLGVLVTFLPLAARDLPAWVPAAALLGQPAASTLSRWVAGRSGDRRGHGRLLVPGVLLSVVGTLGLAGTHGPAAEALVVGGAVVLGLGFGVLQNATLTLMHHRAPAGAAGGVSAVWNAAYDVGMAAGALVAGAVVGGIGYPATFALAAVAMLPALLVVRCDRSRAQLVGADPAALPG